MGLGLLSKAIGPFRGLVMLLEISVQELGWPVPQL